ncbi:MAG TPA: response regulator [Steroidobacteraceae bacterium]|nr:response regulator [Steroidobacteraceae bacterium]
MAGKRALVVDDSKSARVVLSRLLEKYGIEVDSADSAESALDYLRDHHPDVIFMDHLMPGMDGLQAVREIKANPSLASIPIMMYTSQEGEIYGGQARASGAVGVLPKSIRPIDVTKALYQLQLLPERRDGEPSALQSADGEPAAARAQAAQGADPRTRAMVEAMLKEQSVELRRFMVTTLEAHTHRILSELRPREPEPAADAEDLLSSAPPPSRKPWGWMLATGSALVALVVVAVLYWQSVAATRQAERAFEAVTASNESLAQAIENWRIANQRVAAQDANTGGARPMVLSVPFGEQPMAPSRLEAVRNLVGQLERTAISGTIRVETFLGNFCLIGSAAQGYSLAPPATPAAQCEQLGNPLEEAMGPSARQPLAFANLAASVRQRTGGAIELELMTGPRERVVASYPVIEHSTAGQWNAAAQSNNRIEISVVER